jgi:hypothetical protein
VVGQAGADRGQVGGATVNQRFATERTPTSLVGDVEVEEDRAGCRPARRPGGRPAAGSSRRLGERGPAGPAVPGQRADQRPVGGLHAAASPGPGRRALGEELPRCSSSSVVVRGDPVDLAAAGEAVQHLVGAEGEHIGRPGQVVEQAVVYTALVSTSAWQVTSAPPAPMLTQEVSERRASASARAPAVPGRQPMRSVQLRRGRAGGSARAGPVTRTTRAVRIRW